MTAPQKKIIVGVMNFDFSDAVMARAVEAGITWMRVELLWGATEQARNVWNWSQSDRIVAQCQKYGIQCLAILDYSAPWAASIPGNQFSAPADFPAWLNYVAAVVQRYPTMKHFEIWNEPNHESFWNLTPADYADLLELTYHTIRHYRADAVVHAGGTAGIDVDWYKALYDLRVAGHFDVLDVHSYLFRQRKGGVADHTEGDKLAAIYALMKSHGDGAKSIWVTEVGWSTNPTPNLTPGKFLETDVTVQVPDCLNYLSGNPYVGAAFIFNFTETCKADNTAQCWGLLHDDLTLKPGFTALQKWILSHG